MKVTPLSGGSRETLSLAPLVVWDVVPGVWPSHPSLWEQGQGRVTGREKQTERWERGGGHVASSSGLSPCPAAGVAPRGVGSQQDPVGPLSLSPGTPRSPPPALAPRGLPPPAVPSLACPAFSFALPAGPFTSLSPGCSVFSPPTPRHRGAPRSPPPTPTHTGGLSVRPWQRKSGI